jgi:hypothetical protein
MATWAPARQHSPLGDDQLIPIALMANEQISQPFTFHVYAVCQQGLIDPNARLNQPCCITLQNAESPVRYFHGIVQAISAVRGQAVVDQFQAYHLVPRTGPEGPDDLCQSRQPAVPPAPRLTGTTVAGSVALAAVRGDVARRDARLHRFLESGCNVATGGPGRLPAATG